MSERRTPVKQPKRGRYPYSPECVEEEFSEVRGSNLQAPTTWIVAKVEQTKTGSRNKVEFGTPGPVPAGGFGANAEDEDEGPDFSHLAS
jgi:hypothetical protein